MKGLYLWSPASWHKIYEFYCTGYYGSLFDKKQLFEKAKTTKVELKKMRESPNFVLKTPEKYL